MNSAEPKVTVTIEKFYPVYNQQIQNENICYICLKQLDYVCIDCQAANIHDTNACPCSTCKCGHTFHNHCIRKWQARDSHCPQCGELLEVI